MRKLSLKLDELTVESFRTEDQAKETRGTVRAHYGTNHTAASCPGLWTCDYSYCDSCGDVSCQCVEP